MPEIFAHISPAWALMLSGLLCMLSPSHHVRKALMIAAPVVAFLLFVAPSTLGVSGGTFEMMGIEFSTYRLDRLSYPFGLIFIIAAFLNGIYALHERNRLTDSAAQFYAGSALGAVFAGDMLTLFVFWEITAISSVFLIWANGTSASIAAGMRYLAIHVLSGVLLMAGALVLWGDTGSLAFNNIGLDVGLAGWLIFIGIGIKAAFPFLHNWLQDSYPNATVTGAVVLSAFTTKMAIYALARGFAGEEILVWIGAIMTVFPVFFAVVENDLRKVLAYSLNNQLGFMVCAVGVGTALAINGAAAHAFAHIIYKALLFMGMGAVLHRAGTVKASELGGLFRSMPYTTVFTIIGALSISAFPFLSGFVAKAMTMSATAQEGYIIPWLMLLFASAGVLEHSGIKIPYFAFFSHDSKRRPAEAPFNMLVAMGIASALCIFLAWPFGGYQWLYSILPNDLGYNPYTADHVLTQYQLLIAATAAFVILRMSGLYPSERRGTILDFDWIYRKFGYGVVRWLTAMLGRLGGHAEHGMEARSRLWNKRMQAVFHPAGALSRAVPSGSLAIWTTVLLAVALIIAYRAG
ncbi:Na(+)/H(+) antiporter subunit D [Euryhalocaulis caribicus]|uniref:Na(+)/H(+) antiporter subunit D n=1 Tax=Euryhalocaulis caribicus TaxID=1161401 RepID=UPI0003AB17B1|nr:Na(+)/H(+) antiporter subunit D [Euryhalocaulis caribicus]